MREQQAHNLRAIPEHCVKEGRVALPVYIFKKGFMREDELD